MKQALYFLAGALLGLGGGYLIGKRHKNKEKEAVKTEKTVKNDISEDKNEENEPEIEVEDVVLRERYALREVDYDEEYDEDDLQSDIEEIDDYICELDHPEDDDEPAPKGFERITDDDFYTSKPEFDKIKLSLDCSQRILMDGLGNDVTDLFARNGISLDQLYFEAKRGEDLVYYRCWKMDSDYEIMIEEGGSE